MANKADIMHTSFGTGGRARRKNNPTNNMQHAVEMMYMRHLTELCANRFKWVGMPDSVDERYLELTLFYRGGVIFYFDNDVDKYLVQRAANAGPVNHYDNPTFFTISGNGGLRNKNLGPKDCVPIWANYMRTPDLDIVMMYASKLARIDRTIDITIENMRMTKIIAVPENMRTSATNYMRQVMEGQSVVFGAQGMDALKEMITVHDMGIDPMMLPNLQVAKVKLWNECMGLLGINNANQEKKERLVEAEVSANDDQVSAARSIAMNSRLQACNAINAMYGDESPDKGLKVSVRFNDTLDASMPDGVRF
jgi:hypothetical protein